MTERSRRENIRSDLERVDSALRVARLLLNAAEFTDSVSRAYYAMFTAARALLLTEGLESKTHNGVITLLNLHFVKPGHLAPDLARQLGRLRDDREAADYDSSAVFTREMAAGALSAVEAFVEQCRRLIAERGYL